MRAGRPVDGLCEEQDVTDYPWMRAGASEHLDRLVDQMVADIPPKPPPKPFDLDALRRLAAEVDLMRPKVDRMVIAPDVKDRLLALTTRKREVPGPDQMWGIPVLIDEDMSPGHWELRDGDRVVRCGGGASWLPGLSTIAGAQVCRCAAVEKPHVIGVAGYVGGDVPEAEGES
jgi:hypothetical protein